MSPKLSRSFVSLALFFAAATALPQCDSRFQYSGEYRASILDLSLDNNDLWAASGYGVQLYDRSVDPPKLVASTGLPGVTSIVRAANGIAYAAGTNGIAIITRSGKTLQVVHTAAVAGGVNDIAVMPPLLFAATNNGILTFSSFDLGSRMFNLPTSNAAVYSLAPQGSLVYAADGDSTIEVIGTFSGTSPSNLGTVTTALVRPTSIKAIGSRLYVSDGLRTEVLTGTAATFTSLGLLPYGGRSVADLGSNVVMIAGADRQVRVIDATLPLNYVELFDAELPPSGGMINRVTALQVSGGRVYAGGGDIGLATFDISHFAAPYPLRAYGIGAASSVVTLPTAIYVSLAGGGIQEMTRQTTGTLQVGRVWDTTVTSTVQDGSGAFLLSSSNARLTYWFLNAVGSPTIVSTASFAAPIRTACLSGPGSAIVLLQDGTLWTADLSQAAPAPVRVASAYSALTQLAHSDAGTAATDISSDATATTVHFWSGDLNAAPADVRIPGAATALALDGSTAAVFTFRGITMIDFTTSTQTLLPGSNDAITTALAMSGGKVIAQTQAGAVRVWDIGSQTLQKEFAVPGGSVDIGALQGSTVVGVATSNGLAAIDYGVATSQPALITRSGTNTYYKKAVANATHLYLFDGRTIDIYNLKSTTAPSWTGSVFAPGTLDIAASDTALFTLSSTGVVTEYSTAGLQLLSRPLDEGPDVTPLGITTAGGAPWVSFSRRCKTTGCEKRMDVLDPQSLVRTSSFAGGTVDVTTSGSRAFAIFDLPSEIRIYEISDPLYPSPHATAPNNAGAVAIAYSSNTAVVYALGDKAYAYSDRTLTEAGSQLTSQKPGTFADLLIDNGCATIAGRSPSPETYTLPAWTAGNAIPVPGNIRSMLFASGRLIILTDYSIEIWSRNAAPVPVKRRATKE